MMRTYGTTALMRGIFTGIHTAFLIVICSFFTAIATRAETTSNEATWQSIRPDLFGNRPIADGSGLISLETPYRAHDAALVPIAFSAKTGMRLKRVTIVIDENPAPLAAVIDFGPAAGRYAIAARFRINAYSHVRAIAEDETGKLYMIRNFVKASGGCSAPNTRSANLTADELGQMKLRTARINSELSEANLLLRHPNNSGLQMDQVTGYFIPAHFIDVIDIRQDRARVLRLEGGISLSENPAFRFYVQHAAGAEISVQASDTEQNQFQSVWNLGEDM